MRVDSIGEVIAVRRLFLLNEPTREILVKMGAPKKTPGEEDYYCPFQITGIGYDSPEAVVGIDGFQAMQLAMRYIGSKLLRLNRVNGGRLRWECDELGGFGFPVLQDDIVSP